jgi:hypothetical protein
MYEGGNWQSRCLSLNEHFLGNVTVMSLLRAYISVAGIELSDGFLIVLRPYMVDILAS